MSRSELAEAVFQTACAINRVRAAELRGGLVGLVCEACQRVSDSQTGTCRVCHRQVCQRCQVVLSKTLCEGCATR